MQRIKRPPTHKCSDFALPPPTNSPSKTFPRTIYAANPANMLHKKCSEPGADPHETLPVGLLQITTKCVSADRRGRYEVRLRLSSKRFRRTMDAEVFAPPMTPIQNPPVGKGKTVSPNGLYNGFAKKKINSPTETYSCKGRTQRF